VDTFKPITKEHAAEVLSISVRGLEKWIAEGAMPAPVAIEGRRYWHPTVFYGWLEKRLTPSGVPDGAVLPGPTAAAPGSGSAPSVTRQRSGGPRAKTTRDVGTAAIGRHRARLDAKIRGINEQANKESDSLQD